jgi:hypothetical protein
MEMSAQIVANVIPLFIVLAPNLLPHNNVRITIYGYNH